MKYYNFETIFTSTAENLKEFLTDNGYKFELSGAFNNYRFEILLTPEEVTTVNSFLSTI